jgi:hypothetical protein
LELAGELDRTRAADLVQRIETAVGAAGVQIARERLRRFAKKAAG